MLVDAAGRVEVGVVVLDVMDHAVRLRQHAEQVLLLLAGEVLERQPGLLLLLDAEVADELLERGARAEDVGDADQLAQGLVARLGEEARQPHQGPRAGALGHERLDDALVVLGAVLLLVEGMVDDEAPVVVLGAAQLLRAHAADVVEAQGAGALGAAPVVLHRPVAEQLALGLVVEHRLEQQLVEDLAAARGGVDLAGLLEQGADVDALELDRDLRVGLVAETDLAELAGPLAQLADQRGRLAPGDLGRQPAVVELDDAPDRQVAERRDPGHQRGGQQRLDDAVVVAAGRHRAVGAAEVGRVLGAQALAAVGRGRAVGLLDQRQELVLVQLAGGLEARAHQAVGGLLALGHDVEEVADADQLAEHEVLDVAHQQLGQQLDRGALALQGVRQGDERVDQDRRERVELAERVGVVAGAEQGRPRALLLRLGAQAVEGRGDLGRGGRVAGC